MANEDLERLAYMEMLAHRRQIFELELRKARAETEQAELMLKFTKDQAAKFALPKIGSSS
jgi:hypothetical protein